MARTSELQAAVVRSLGVQQSIDDTLAWLKDTERSLNSAPPISLVRDALNAQLREITTTRSDVQSRGAALEAVNQSAAEMMLACADSRKAKELEETVKDMNLRYGRVVSGAAQRDAVVRSLSEKLAEFDAAVAAHDAWLAPLILVINGDEPVATETMRKIAGELEQDEATAVAKMAAVAESLTENPLSCDVGVVKKRLEGVQRGWAELKKALTNREREEELKRKKGGEFESKLGAVVEWLDKREARLDEMEPVAVDVETIATQTDQLKVSLLQRFLFKIRCLMCLVSA